MKIISEKSRKIIMTEDSLGEKDKLYTNTKIIFSLKFEVFFSLFLESSVFKIRFSTNHPLSVISRLSGISMRATS
jgi:hypothetical protein